jgi:Tfp pilus assembly protein PilF
LTARRIRSFRSDVFGARTRILLATALAALSALGGCPHQAPSRNPQLSNTHYLLGDDLLRKRQPDAAKRELLRAIELDPDNKDAHQLLGMIFFLEGVHKLNLAEREQCLRGVALQEQQREANNEFRRGEGYLRTALGLSEKEKKVDSDVLNTLANIALHFKRYDEAIALCRRALQNILYAQRQFALGTMGWAYLQKGDRQSAARELRQSVFQEPKFCVGRYRLAKVYYEERAYGKAVEELKQVVDDKSCPIQEAHQLLGLALLKQRDPAQARQQFEQCDKLNPMSCVSEECRRYAKLI